MKFPWRAILNAVGLGLAKPADPLPPDAHRELDLWDAETVARYKAEHGGEAPPGAPHVDDEGI